MAGKKKKPTQKQRPNKNLKCPFCTEAREPSYKEYKLLEIFLSDRARILGSVRTGVCSTHQRGLTREIKRARHLGLLPFTPFI